MNIFPLHEFSRPTKAFLLTKMFAYTQSAFAQFLINIYFWRITKNISFLVLYNSVFVLFHTLAYIPASKFAKEHNRFVPLRAGMILQLAYLAMILVLREKVIEYIIPVALVGGVAHGSYWTSDNLLKLDLTNPDNRLRFTSIIQILQSIANSLCPLLASLVVLSDGEVFNSYSKVFVAALIFAALTLISSFYVSDMVKLEGSKFSLVATAKTLLRDRNIRIACASNFLTSVSEVLPILLGLMLFISSGTELSLGSYQFVTVSLVIMTNYVMGKYGVRKHYRRLLYVGGALDFLLVFILFLSQSYGAILLYGILKALVSFMSAPAYALTLDAFNIHCKDSRECVDQRVEYLMLGEICVSGGKLAGLLVLLLLLRTSLSPVLIGSAVALLSLADMLSSIYVTKIQDGPHSNIDHLN